MWWWLFFGSALAQPAPLSIDGATAKRTLTCEAGQDVHIDGAALTITLQGDCGEVTVDGASNVITVDGVTAVRVTGSMNKVTWSRNLSEADSLPTTSVGARNKIRRSK